jgi:hypothetical protein
VQPRVWNNYYNTTFYEYVSGRRPDMDITNIAKNQKINLKTNELLNEVIKTQVLSWKFVKKT